MWYAPLLIAAQLGDEAAARAALDGGASVESRDWHDEKLSDVSSISKTALHFAAAGGHLGVVRLLLDRGADVNSTTMRGETPLHLAATEGNAACAKLLLERGADVHASVTAGSTPLYYAAYGGHSRARSCFWSTTPPWTRGITGIARRCTWLLNAATRSACACCCSAVR